jgi:hypothetical protein
LTRILVADDSGSSGWRRPAPHLVDAQAGPQQGLVTDVAGLRQPAQADHVVETVAMQHQQLAAVRRGVDHLVRQMHVAVVVRAAQERSQKAVVVAGDVIDLGAAPRLGQHLLDHARVVRRPVEVRLHLPAVDDVADQIQFFAVVMRQEARQPRRLAAGEAKVHVGNPEGAHPRGLPGPRSAP